MNLPKTVRDIFDKYEQLTGWKSGELENEIINSPKGKQNCWTYQNVKTWVADYHLQYPNIATIYVNSIYDRQNDSLPCELNSLRHLIKKD